LVVLSKGPFPLFECLCSLSNVSVVARNISTRTEAVRFLEYFQDFR
jgi:hypothetical protein